MEVAECFYEDHDCWSILPERPRYYKREYLTELLQKFNSNIEYGERSFIVQAPDRPTLIRALVEVGFALGVMSEGK